MSRLNIRTLFGLLFAVHLGVDLTLSPFHLPKYNGNVSSIISAAAIGTLIAQPALLALWAGLASQAFSRRFKQSLILLALAYLAVDFAAVHNSDQTGQGGEALMPLAWLIGFAVCQLPLWLLRKRFAWQIEPPVGVARPSGIGDNQFSVRGLLAAVSAVALFFAAVRLLHPQPDSDPDRITFLVIYAAMGASLAVPGIAVLLTAWLVLASGPRNRWKWALGVVGGCAVAATATAVYFFGSQGEVGEFLAVLAGTLLSAGGSVMVLRLCGYRLVRAGGAQPPALGSSASPSLVRRRFALAAAPLVLLLVVLALLLPRRATLWREMAETRRWRDRGLYATAFADGELISISANDGSRLVIDAQILDGLADCESLEQLDLSTSAADDRTLAQLAPLPQLTELSLFGTLVTNEGLQYLAKLPKLKELDLSMTEVSDAGLRTLATLKGLRSLRLECTRATYKGIDWLRDERPDLTIYGNTSDAELRRVAQLFWPGLGRLAGRRKPSPIELRLHAAGPAVTDAGIARLRGIPQIAELDLTNAQVTDAAINDLTTLTGLKRVVLRGTQVTDFGMRKLQQALPKCEIAR